MYSATRKPRHKYATTATNLSILNTAAPGSSTNSATLNPLNSFRFVSPTYSADGQAVITITDDSLQQPSSRVYNCSTCRGQSQGCKSKNACVYCPTCYRSPSLCSYRRGTHDCNASETVLLEQITKRKSEQLLDNAARVKKSRAKKRRVSLSSSLSGV